MKRIWSLKLNWIFVIGSALFRFGMCRNNAPFLIYRKPNSKPAASIESYYSDGKPSSFKALVLIRQHLKFKRHETDEISGSASTEYIQLGATFFMTSGCPIIPVVKPLCHTLVLWPNKVLIKFMSGMPKAGSQISQASAMELSICVLNNWLIDEISGWQKKTSPNSQPSDLVSGSR